MSAFNTISRELIDAWLQRGETAVPEDLYTGVIERLNVKMALSVVVTSAADPYDWRFRRVKDFGFKSRLLTQMKQQFPDAALRDLDRAFIDDAVIPAYTRALEVGRPLLELVTTRLLGVRIGYQRLILPQKSEEGPAWCISLVEGRFFVAPVKEAKTDITDDNIIQLLIEGQTTKEIGALLHLSPRTTEHRIDRLKTRFEASNVVHLLAKLIASQMDGSKIEKSL